MCDFRPFFAFFRGELSAPLHDLVGEPPEGHKIVSAAAGARRRRATYLFLLCFQCDHCISLLLADKR
jgi:hypothetical protein